MVLKDT